MPKSRKVSKQSKNKQPKDDDSTVSSLETKSDLSDFDKKFLGTNLRHYLIKSILKLQTEQQKYGWQTVDQWLSKTDKVVEFEERFSASIKVSFQAGSVTFFTYVKLSDAPQAKALRAVCEFGSRFDYTLKYDTYDVAWLFFKKFNNYQNDFHQMFSAEVQDLELTCWKRDRVKLLKSVCKFGELKKLQKLTIDLSLMCTTEQEDFVFLQKLLKELTEHIDKIEKLQFFKINIKILHLDGELFKKSSILQAFLSKMQQKTESNPEFKAVIQHDKYEKQQAVILSFPIESKKWTELDKQLNENVSYQIF